MYNTTEYERLQESRRRYEAEVRALLDRVYGILRQRSIPWHVWEGRKDW